MVRAIIFDLYGVLAINGWQAFKSTHFAEREDIWDQVFQLGRQVDAGLSDYAELVRFTAEAANESEATVRYQLEHTVANAPLLDFIGVELRDSYRLGILSNANNEDVITRIFTPDQCALFDAITMSHHIGMTKPDTRMYEVAASKLDVPVGSCVFIDDQERHAAGARDAGMQALVYREMTEFKEELRALL